MNTSHIAFICKDSAAWALKKKKKLYEGYRASFKKINELLGMQIKKNIPIMTVFISPKNLELPNEYSALVDELVVFMNELGADKTIHNNRVKISVLGKWYEMPPRLIESIKKLIDQTKEYDEYFLNLCINYDGQEEIVDAARMVARRVKLGKIDPENITKDAIKDDLYSSYFMPPDIIFVSGKRQSTYGFLLWDSVDSKIVFMNKAFCEIPIRLIEKHLKKKKAE
ncbi:undecaprenyl diphosphate synthase family protein [Candidatus Woesearchaeota archaeon]|nr:undecaprenyl diphosphate synthase family protein [Candidatus Woesearchaeota archaeon]